MSGRDDLDLLKRNGLTQKIRRLNSLLLIYRVALFSLAHNFT